MVMPFIVMVAVVRIVRIMQTGVLDSVGTEVRSEFGKAKGTTIYYAVQMQSLSKNCATAVGMKKPAKLSACSYQ